MYRNLLTVVTLLVALSSVAVAQEADVEALEPAVSPATLAGMASSVAVDAVVPELPVEGKTGPSVKPIEVVDEIELDVTEITGNQELPKMLYIVPWQKSDTGDLVDKPVTDALDDVLAPITRTEFIRQVDYYGDLYGDVEE